VLNTPFNTFRKFGLNVNDDMEESAVTAITDAAKTGKIGDGKIFILDLQSAVRVRTGEQNEEAL